MNIFICALKLRKSAVSQCCDLSTESDPKVWYPQSLDQCHSLLSLSRDNFLAHKPERQ